MGKVYPVGIVGEQNYQDSIGTCLPGERVYVCIEYGNPYDADALKVETAGGRTIGYIARDHWLRDAIHERGLGCVATIKAITGAGHDIRGVVIDVTVTDDELRERDYVPPSSPAAPTIPSLHPIAHKAAKIAGGLIASGLKSLFK